MSRPPSCTSAVHNRGRTETPLRRRWRRSTRGGGQGRAVRDDAGRLRAVGLDPCPGSRLRAGRAGRAGEEVRAKGVHDAPEGLAEVLVAVAHAAQRGPQRLRARGRLPLRDGGSVVDSGEDPPLRVGEHIAKYGVLDAAGS